MGKSETNLEASGDMGSDTQSLFPQGKGVPLFLPIQMCLVETLGQAAV